MQLLTSRRASVERSFGLCKALRMTSLNKKKLFSLLGFLLLFLTWIRTNLYIISKLFLFLFYFPLVPKTTHSIKFHWKPLQPWLLSAKAPKRSDEQQTKLSSARFLSQEISFVKTATIRVIWWYCELFLTSLLTPLVTDIQGNPQN